MHFGKAVLLILVSTRLNPLPKARNCVMYSVCWTAAMNTELLLLHFRSLDASDSPSLSPIYILTNAAPVLGIVTHDRPSSMLLYSICMYDTVQGAHCRADGYSDQADASYVPVDDMLETP